MATNPKALAAPTCGYTTDDYTTILELLCGMVYT